MGNDTGRCRYYLSRDERGGSLPVVCSVSFLNNQETLKPCVIVGKSHSSFIQDNNEVDTMNTSIGSGQDGETELFSNELY